MEQRSINAAYTIKSYPGPIQMALIIYCHCLLYIILFSSDLPHIFQHLMFSFRWKRVCVKKRYTDSEKGINWQCPIIHSLCSSNVSRSFLGRW